MSFCAGNIGTKFNEDGSVRFFPGNTIISMIDHQAPVFKAFMHLRGMLMAKPAVRCCAMLPEDSIHMTVMEGVCHQWRKSELWTCLLPLDCRLSQVDDLFEARFKQIQPLGEVHMRMEKICEAHCFTIRLAPVSEADLAELTRYRNALSDALGVRFPNHDKYRFHISLCYFISEPTAQEAAQLADFVREADAYIAANDITFTVQQPVLTYFDNMFHFSPVRIPRGAL